MHTPYGRDNTAVSVNRAHGGQGSAKQFRDDSVAMASSSESRRCRQKHYCPHCNDYLPKSTFYRHRDSFFNPVSIKWLSESDYSDRARARKT